MLAVGLFVGVGFMTIGELNNLRRGEQIIRQLIAVGVSFGCAFATTVGILYVPKYIIGLRMDQQ